MSYKGDLPDLSGAGPFQANTRVVAIIALVVAGVFVMLGLSLSVVRAFQQRAAERVITCLASSLAFVMQRCKTVLTPEPAYFTSEDIISHYLAWETCR